MNPRYVLGLVAIVSLAATIALAIATLVLGTRFINYESLAWTTVTIAGHAAVALGLIITRERGKLKTAALIGLLLAGFSPLFWFVIIWSPDLPSDEDLIFLPVASTATGWVQATYQ